MKLFKVYRTDEHIGYDEYDAIVVRAKDADRAREIALTGDHGYGYTGFGAHNIAVEELATEGEEETILASFNAG